jgi:uncharacterized protein (TIGR03790 family)
MRCPLLLLALSAAPAAALEPKDVFVVANKNVPASREVADHYLAKRGVPRENLILLDLPAGEDISRPDYDAKLAAPLRAALGGKKAAAKVILTVYGVPLRVGEVPLTAAQKAEGARVQGEAAAAKKALDELEKNKAAAKDVEAARRTFLALDERWREITHSESTACVDNELMLLWWPKYPLRRWVPNPLYFQASDKYRGENPPAVMTARLDGPTPAVAKRLVDDAVAAEAKGLDGLAVIDARGIKFDPASGDSGHGYGGYDESFREAARLLERAGLRVLLDDKEPVLPANSAKGVAVYAGWYSLANFVDACEFVPGAVAWHLASSEAGTLRDPNAKLWCPNLLKKGAAATIGPVAEPYTIGFPKPAEFFGFLATGEYTLVETYSRSLLFCSWMTVLVGDPLYNPFKKTPRLKSADVPPSPKGGKNISP